MTDEQNSHVAILTPTELLIPESPEEAPQVACRRVVLLFEVCEHSSILWKSCHSKELQMVVWTRKHPGDLKWLSGHWQEVKFEFFWAAASAYTPRQLYFNKHLDRW